MLCSCRMALRACAAAVALRAYAAAEWRWEACGCLMALRCATPLSARRPAAGVCGGRVALQGVRRPNGAADTMWARGSVQSYGDACELCFLNAEVIACGRGVLYSRTMTTRVKCDS